MSGKWDPWTTVTRPSRYVGAPAESVTVWQGELPKTAKDKGGVL
jgi:hypothetical protein